MPGESWTSLKAVDVVSESLALSERQRRARSHPELEGFQSGGWLRLAACEGIDRTQFNVLFDIKKGAELWTTSIPV